MLCCLKLAGDPKICFFAPQLKSGKIYLGSVVNCALRLPYLQGCFYAGLGGIRKAFKTTSEAFFKRKSGLRTAFKTTLETALIGDSLLGAHGSLGTVTNERASYKVIFM